MGKPAITNNVRRLRFDADEMTQADLAAKADVTSQTIIAIEGANIHRPWNWPSKLPMHLAFLWNPCSNIRMVNDEISRRQFSILGRHIFRK
jgi:predicted transcriptional regulator